MTKALGAALALRLALSSGPVPPPGLELWKLTAPFLPTLPGVLLDPSVLPSHVDSAHSARAQLLEVAAGPWHLVLPGENRWTSHVPHGSRVHRGSQSPSLQSAKGSCRWRAQQLDTLLDPKEIGTGVATAPASGGVEQSPGSGLAFRSDT